MVVCPGRISCKHTSSTTPRGGLSTELGGQGRGSWWRLAACPSAWLGCPRCSFFFAAEPQENTLRWRPFRASHRGNDNHEVRRDVGDAGKEVRGQPGEVTLGELTGWEDLQHIGGLEEERKWNHCLVTLPPCLCLVGLNRVLQGIDQGMMPPLSCPLPPLSGMGNW